MFNILVCEDDYHIRKLMCEYLVQDGYTICQCQNGEEAFEILDNTHIDLLVTDVMMPIMDGFELSAAVRDYNKDMPILIITAKSSIDDKRTGFSTGADDYMVKPFDMDEMLFRVSALLRRAKIDSDKKLVVGNSVFDYNDFTVTVGNNTFQLPNKEFRIIFKLLSQPKHIFTRFQLMNEIWGFDNESAERTVDVHIRKLREKFEGNPDFEIVTVKNLGYKAVKFC
jgi:DNA-binding response OmpR family regulator